MALSSPIGKLEYRVNAAEVDALDNRSRTLDGNCTIGMYSYYLEGGSLGCQFLIDVCVSDIDKLANLVLMLDA
eukprot:7629705-Ditylum_brightwellii.AAC.1